MRWNGISAMVCASLTGASPGVVASCGGDPFLASRSLQTSMDASGELDADATDAGPVDAAAGVDAGPASPSCLSPPLGTLFCADFDRVGTAGETWTRQNGYGGGTNELDTDASVSPPQSYVASVPARVASAGGAGLEHLLTVAAPIVEYAFQMRIEQFDTSRAVTAILARLALDPVATRPILLELLGTQGGLVLHTVIVDGDAGGGDGRYDLRMPLPVGRWVRVRYELSRVPTLVLRLFVDEAKVYDGPVPTTRALPADVRASLGPSFVSSPSEAIRVRYDDAIVRGR